MAFLLIFRKDQKAFAEQESLEKLRSIGVRTMERNSVPGAAVFGHFDFDGDSVIVELKSDLKTFVVSDLGPAGFEFAVQLQARFDEPLKIVDEAFSFDVELKSFRTATELKDFAEKTCRNT